MCDENAIEVNGRCLHDDVAEVSVSPLVEDFNHTQISSDWIQHGGVSLFAILACHAIEFDGRLTKDAFQL